MKKMIVLIAFVIWMVCWTTAADQYGGVPGSTQDTAVKTANAIVAWSWCLGVMVLIAWVIHQLFKPRAVVPAMLMQCPTCSGTISNHASTCPHCGQPTGQQKGGWWFIFWW